jgi:hypothetical protein
MADPFYSSRRGVIRAQHHIHDLNTRINAFIDSKPYARMTEIHDDGISQAHKIKLNKPFPEELSDIAADSIYNLRAALDRAGYAAAVLWKGGDPENTYFPFADNASELTGRIRQRHSDIPQDIYRLMVDFQPYKGGNHLLWALNKACNSNKHRLLAPVGLFSDGALFKSFEVVKGPARLIPPVWNREKNEAIYCIAPADSEFNHDIEISISVVFDEVDAIKNQKVIPALNMMAYIVRTIVDAIEAKAIEIGLLKSP